MRRIFIPLLILSLLVSCSPIDYPSSDYSSTDIEKVEALDPEWGVEKGSKNAVVSFSPLEGVDSYTLILSSSDGEKTFSVLPSSFSLGRFYREVKGLKPDTTYSVSLMVECGGEKGEVKETLSFKTEDGTSDKPEYAPYAFCSERNANSASIHFNLEKGMWYRMVIHSNDENYLNTKEYIFSSVGFSGTYLIEDLDDDTSYTLTIQHGKKNGEWGVVKRDVEIGKYQVEKGIDLSLNGSLFTISTDPSANMYLLSQNDKSFAYKITKKEFEIPLSILPSMERDQYYVYDADSGKVSNAVSFTSPMKTEVSVTPDSITLEWDEKEEALYFVEVEVKSDNDKRVIPTPVVPDVESDGERGTLKLDKLVSNTPYEIKITFTLPDGASTTYSETIKTESYAGTYAWLGYPSDGIRSAFWVDVRESDDSAYPYYITVSEKDPAYDGNKYQIMPLIDDSLPGYVPIVGNIKYSNTSEEYMRAYRWNAKKWNTTSMAPSAWRPQSTTINGDSVTSLVYSKAIGMDLYTKTQFTFRMKDGKKELVFYNAGEGSNAGFVNIGLFTNKNPSPGLDKYSFVLSFVEGGDEE